MADIAIFRINYKSDFILTLNSDAGWAVPFCIKFWTGAPSQAYFVGFDGTTYTHCAPVDGEPTKLRVQFDDHNLPIGDLKFQIGYHFTVADFPTSVEDEVLNQASVIIEVDDAPAQVMLDLNGETAPEIEFSLPAYANEAQRIANEEERIEAEQQRIANENVRIAAEETRQQNEQQRINQETARVSEFATLKSQSQAATRDANAAATLANEKAQLAADKAALADAAATLAIQKAQLAADKAALANDAAQLAADKAALAQQKAEYAQQQGGYAKNQGDYAKEQGDTALADHQRAEADHGIAVDDHTQAGNDHTRAESDHGIAVDDHTQAGNDHTRAESDHGIAADDHTQAGNDHTRAESDHGIAADDHTQAGNDHTRAESDHTRAESDHAAVEVYVDSLGAFDISAYHATGGVLAEYADLTAALGTNGANIPDALRKGGMSVKFVQSSDNKYVQYRYMGTATTGSPNPFINTANWQGVDDVPTAGSNNLVKSNGVFASIENIRTEVHNFKKCYLTKPGWVSSNNGTLKPSTDYSYGEITGLQQGDIIKVYSMLVYSGANVISAYNNGEYISSKSVTGRNAAFNGYYEVPSGVNKIIIGCSRGVSNPYYFILYRKNEYGDLFYKSIIENHLAKTGYFYGNVGSKINIQNSGAFVYAKIDITGFNNIGIGFDDKGAYGHYSNENTPPVAITDEDDIILWKNADFVNYDSIDVSLYQSAKYLYLFIGTHISNQIFTFNSIKDVIHKTNEQITSVNKEIKNIEEKTFSAEDFTTIGYIDYNTGAIISSGDSFHYIELNVNSGDLLDYYVYMPYNLGASLAFYRNGIYDKSISLPKGSYGGKLIIPSGVDMLRAQTTTTSPVQAYLKVSKYVPAYELYAKDETFFGGICKYTDFVISRRNTLYFKNLGNALEDVKKYFYISFNASSAPNTMRYCREYLDYTPTESYNKEVTFIKKENVYDLVDSCETTFRAISKNTGSGETKNIIFIGDSLIANGIASEQVYNMLVEDGDYTINMLGDHIPEVGGVPQPNRVNAGHGAWSWTTWTTPSAEIEPLYGMLNPFYHNGELDFQNFMSTKYPNLSGIDIAVISLGTNDMGQNGIEPEQMQIYKAQTALERAKTFVDALIQQYPNCKVIIGLPSGGAADFSAGLTMYPSGFKASINIYNKIFKDTFDNGVYSTNVTCVYHGWFIDNEFDYNYADTTLPSGETFKRYYDMIHPKDIGYQHWGIGYYNKIRAILAGLL